MIAALTWAAVALGVAGALSVCVLAIRRLFVARNERLQGEREARLRPLALALLDGEDLSPAALPERDVQALARLLARYGRLLRGESSELIARFFEACGGVDREFRHLGSVRAWRRATSAFTLGDMGSTRAVPALLAALEDPKREVRAAAARSLGRLGALAAVEPLVHALAEGKIPRAVAGQALLAIGPAALPGLRRLETDEDANARAFAVELVGLLGDASDDARVLERLRDSSAEVRAKAARALGRLGAEEAADELATALRDRIVFVRAAAAHALEVVGDTEAVSDLLRVAREDPFDAARAAAHAVRRLDPEALVVAAAKPHAGPFLREAADLASAWP